MKNHAIVPYSTENYLDFLNNLKESFLLANLKYSSYDLQLILELSEDEIENSIKNAIAICQFVGIDSTLHFKEFFVFDVDFNTINSNWRMSKKGFNLVIMQFQKLNQKNAIWLWRLADN